MQLRLILTIFLTMSIASYDSIGQDIDTGPGFQTLIMNNPALSGSEGNAILRLSYLNYLPGNNINLHSFFVSYDSYFSKLHGGLGIYMSDDYLGGIVNDIKGGLSYSYFLKAGRDLYINAGLSASFYSRGFNFSGAVLPDQIDLYGNISSASAETLTERGRTIFDMGAGFIFIAGNISGGFSIAHLTEPSLYENNISVNKLKRKATVHISGDFSTGNNSKLYLRPLFFSTIQDKFITTSLGIVVEYNHLSVNAITIATNTGNLNLQTGFSITMGTVTAYYNYRFNILSQNFQMPFSLQHQTGLVFSLNYVDKRNGVKTIKIPKL
jgi:type IX secretion system PorP/SprF family membrane protein